MIKKIMYVLSISVLIGGCSNTFPVAVVIKEVPGGIMRGEVHGTRAGGSFSVSAGKLKCAGDWGDNDMSSTIVIAVLCNDGRKGIVTAVRNGIGGGGRFTLNDGTSGDFIYGDAALRL